MTNICIISSCIYTSSKPLCYTNTRSIFTSEERISHTKNTILSIKKYIPNVFIILVDNSMPIGQLKENIFDVDKLICIESEQNPNKGIDETKEIITALQYIKKKFNVEDVNMIYKISGRYELNKEWKYDIFNQEKIIFKKQCTIFYGFHSKYLDYFTEHLKNIVNNNNTNYTDSIETLITQNIKFIVYVDKIGVHGYIAVVKDAFIEQ